MSKILSFADKDSYCILYFISEPYIVYQLGSNIKVVTVNRFISNSVFPIKIQIFEK